MIQIKVFMDEAAFKAKRSVYERLVKPDEDFWRNLSSVYFTMRGIYGMNSVVTFNVFRYEV